jgi:hypothetical protein
VLHTRAHPLRIFNNNVASVFHNITPNLCAYIGELFIAQMHTYIAVAPTTIIRPSIIAAEIK